MLNEKIKFAAYASKMHTLFSFCVALILPLWIIFDFHSVNRIWEELAAARLIGAMICFITGFLCLKKKISYISCGYIFNAVLYIGVGLTLPFLQENEIAYWCLGYATCFLTSSVFQTWSYKHHLISLGVTFFIIPLSIYCCADLSLIFYIKNGLLLTTSVALVSSAFVILKINLLNKNLLLENQLLKETEQKQKLYDDLLQQEKMATIGLLAAGVAHQLGNTLNTISTSHYWLEKSFKDGNLSDLILNNTIDTTKKAIAVSTQIIRGLDYASKKNIESEVCSVKELIDTAIILSKGRMFEKVKVSLEIPSDLTFYGKSNDILQAVINIIINAADALMEKTDAKVHITAKNKDHDTNITISDNGPGIPENIQNKIYEVFSTTKNAKGGSGMGLYIAKKQIEENGGSIHFTSSANGTTFSIMLKKEK